jgi:hypothetical protein
MFHSSTIHFSRLAQHSQRIFWDETVARCATVISTEGPHLTQHEGFRLRLQFHSLQFPLYLHICVFAHRFPSKTLHNFIVSTVLRFTSVLISQYRSAVLNYSLCNFLISLVNSYDFGRHIEHFILIYLMLTHFCVHSISKIDSTHRSLQV